MKKAFILIIVVLFAQAGFSQIKPLVVKNELPTSVIVNLNQIIEGISRSSVVFLEPDETSILEVTDRNSTVTMQFKNTLEKIPVNNRAYKRQLKSSKGDCVVCTIDKLFENPFSQEYYFKCRFKSGILKDYTTN